MNKKIFFLLSMNCILAHAAQAASAAQQPTEQPAVNFPQHVRNIPSGEILTLTAEHLVAQSLVRDGKQKKLSFLFKRSASESAPELTAIIHIFPAPSDWANEMIILSKTKSCKDGKPVYAKHSYVNFSQHYEPSSHDQFEDELAALIKLKQTPSIRAGQ